MIGGKHWISDIQKSFSHYLRAKAFDLTGTMPISQVCDDEVFACEALDQTASVWIKLIATLDQ